jgi:hypothetical protein
MINIERNYKECVDPGFFHDAIAQAIPRKVDRKQAKCNHGEENMLQIEGKIELFFSGDHLLGSLEFWVKKKAKVSGLMRIVFFFLLLLKVWQLLCEHVQAKR